MEIMYEKGVSGTSLAEISEKAGVSKGTLYYYYSAKEDLIFDIADKNMEQISTDLLHWIDSIASTESPVKILETVIDKIVQAELRNRLHLYLVQEAITGSQILRDSFMKKYSHWRELIVEGIQKILGENKDSEVMSTVLLTMLDGLVIQYSIGIRDIPVEDISSYLIRCVEKSI